MNWEPNNRELKIWWTLYEIVYFSFSILDQQQKQTIPFVGGRCMGEFDGRIFVSTSRDVYSLISIPVEKQVT